MQGTIDIAIEAAGPADAPELFDLLRGVGLPVDGLDAHLSTTLVARDEKRIVGSAGLEVYGGSALLRSVAVAAGMQGAGLGRQLVEAAENRAREAGVSRLYLLTETAGAWFPRFGYTPIARAAVDPAVQASVEFTTACPASAQAMMKNLK